MSERIVGVAVRYGSIFASQEAPARHHHILHEASRLGLEDEGPDAQGFVTNAGRFVDRTEACRIARDAGQIVKKHGPASILFSEDVW